MAARVRETITTAAPKTMDKELPLSFSWKPARSTKGEISLYANRFPTTDLFALPIFSLAAGKVSAATRKKLLLDLRRHASKSPYPGSTEKRQ
jgi:hypothetical protein